MSSSFFNARSSRGKPLGGSSLFSPRPSSRRPPSAHVVPDSDVPGAGAEPDDGEEGPLASEAYMACVAAGARVGCAFYEPSTGVLSLCETYESAGSASSIGAAAAADAYAGIQLLKFHVRPVVIYTSSKADDGLLEALRTRPGPAARVGTRCGEGG